MAISKWLSPQGKVVCSGERQTVLLFELGIFCQQKDNGPPFLGQAI